jgi:hypothetical protein
MSSLQESGWACAFVLCTDYADRLTPEQRDTAECARLVAPDRVDPERAAQIMALWRTVVDTRI